MFSLNITLALVILLFTPIACFIPYYVTKKTKNLYKKQQAGETELRLVVILNYIFFVKHNSVFYQYLLQFFYVQGREVVRHSRGSSRSLARHRAAGDNSHNIPQRLVYGSASSCADEILNLGAVKRSERYLVDRTALSPV